MKQLSLLIAAAVLFAALQPTTAKAKNDNLIVPGVRIGPVSLGMTDADVYKTLGEPTSTLTVGSADGGINYYWGNLYSVHVDKDTHRVTQVTTSDQKYSTTEGIKVGSSLLAVSVKLRIPLGHCSGMCDYNVGHGMYFGTNENGGIRAIWIVPVTR